VQDNVELSHRTSAHRNRQPRNLLPAGFSFVLGAGMRVEYLFAVSISIADQAVSVVMFKSRLLVSPFQQ
jgi:hypothetical protein